ncbi:DNA resolvase [Gluconacetobacter sacchari DSM 12717]|uniref:Recombinase family protein n=2 Tax=Gluconacetobacter sacchari TaxID=92759 RepID=A0A7W4IH59_9PROT|nr:recombinase family protein [Gluconacetobacter sacchari]MBB2162741.1 recombinase family protein [Gluconacetobacter sacchari]GBQ27353.1 DNA resolvase [Gluconacetobacter sacchari DSM 12717]
MKVALYARYSSDNQRDASIEDQLRACRSYADTQGWTIVDSYSDRAISGASLIRPGIQDLIADANAGRFQILLTEAMDRLSRDQEDIAGLFKRMSFGGVKIVTLSEGVINHLHIGLTGTMNALYLRELANKTRRGLRGRVEQGKSGGGLSYGYDVVKQRDIHGEAICGERSINHDQAQIVRRIFQAYADGKSPKAIALSLNAAGHRGPLSGVWSPSTINGNRERGTGILNNELYIGRLTWNRLRYIKDPSTGKRVSRLNPESEWTLHDVPDLRIIEQDLWDAVKARQSKTTWSQKSRGSGTHPLNGLRRPTHLLTGLIKCGCCGGGFSMISQNHLGCSTARNKGTCDNRLTIRRDVLEKSVLNGLRTQMMDPGLFHEFCEEFTREVNRLRMEKGADLATLRSELPRIERELDKAIQAILDGVPGSRLKDRIGQLEARKAEIEARLVDAPPPPPLLHPNMARLYRERIETLHAHLQDPVQATQAVEAIRTLITRIKLIPEDGILAIWLEGDLAAMLGFASHKRNAANQKRAASHPDRDVLDAFMVQDTMVAGAGFEPVTFRL